MLNVKSPYRPLLLILLIFGAFFVQGSAQCPPNIGFETGKFTGWECFAGSVRENVNGQPQMQLDPTGPIGGIHQIIEKSVRPQLDRFGNFPITSPNGSRYAIQLGNDAINAGIERISYTFEVPNRKDYTLTYSFAVVFQEPGHEAHQQPRFTVKVFDIKDSTYIDCSSF